MSELDFEAERRENCKENHKQITEVYSWYKGNGNPGAGKRLLALEDLANGKEDTASMTKIKEHINWHEKADRRRWELIFGIILIFATQVATLLINHGGL